MQKGFWLGLVGIFAALIGLFFIMGGQPDGSGQTTKYSYSDPMAIQKQDHRRGQGKVVIIEYGDFQCPGCGSLYPLLRQVENERPKDISIIFRNFPLTSLHVNAMAAHRAAEAAHKQGKFFGMHDLLYENQDLWNTSPNAAAIFEDFAQQLGLKLDQFKTDVASSDTFDRISADIDSGKELGITGTPTLYLNGERLEDIPPSVDEFVKLIDDAKAKLE